LYRAVGVFVRHVDVVTIRYSGKTVAQKSGANIVALKLRAPGHAFLPERTMLKGRAQQGCHALHMPVGRGGMRHVDVHVNVN
jgi:hypothetical protein